MKLNFFVVLLITLVTSFFIACGDDLPTEMIKIDEQTEDYITNPKADTIHISSETIKVDSTLSNPDSIYLLGRYYDKVYGETLGDIITRFHFKEVYPYKNPSEAITYADSTVLTLSFESGAYFGDPNSPIEYRIYELKDSLVEKEDYYTNVNPSKFADYTKLCGNLVQTISQTDLDNNTQKYTVRIKLSSDFTSRFFNTDSKIFSTQSEFNKFFKGLYITTSNINSSVLLKIRDIKLNLYCHYVTKADNKTVKMAELVYPVTNEAKIIRVNRIIHPLYNESLLNVDTTNYISSPANFYTRLRIPIGRMRDSIKVNSGKDLVINSAILKLNVLDKSVMGTDFPYATSLLMIKGNSNNIKESFNTIEKFFRDKKTPDNDSSFLVSISKIATSTTTYNYYYLFSDLNDLIKTEIEKTGKNTDVVDMYLIPVRMVYNSSSSSTYSYLSPATGMQAVAINSGKNKRIPMKMEIVYSGF